MNREDIKAREFFVHFTSCLLGTYKSFSHLWVTLWLPSEPSVVLPYLKCRQRNSIAQGCVNRHNVLPVRETGDPGMSKMSFRPCFAPAPAKTLRAAAGMTTPGPLRATTLQTHASHPGLSAGIYLHLHLQSEWFEGRGGCSQLQRTWAPYLQGAGGSSWAWPLSWRPPRAPGLWRPQTWQLALAGSTTQIVP